jgi:hypothetical protein
MDWASLSLGKSEIMLVPGHGPPSLWFCTDRIDDVYRLFKSRQLGAAQAALPVRMNRRSASKKTCMSRSTEAGSSAFATATAFRWYSSPGSRGRRARSDPDGGARVPEPVLSQEGRFIERLKQSGPGVSVR